MASEPHVAEKLEPPGVDLRAVLLAGFGAMVLLAVAIAGLSTVYRWQVPSRVLSPPQTFPEPQLRVDENGQLRRLQAEQSAKLAGYVWVDRAHGLVRIPIERAMQLIVAAGPKAYDPIVPSAAALAAPTAGAQRATSRQGASPAPTAAPDAPVPPGNAAERKP
jgi:hypothetical protein